MEQGDGIKVDLEDDVLIFHELAAFAHAFEASGQRLHVVGGVAVTLWGRYTGTQRPGMTSDIDSVVTSAVMKGQMEEFARTTDMIMRERGYSRPEGWENTRADRFRFVGEQGVKFELLCGTPTVGGASGTPPAHRLYRDRGSNLVLYAAKVPWLDYVSSWIRVEVNCGSQNCLVNAPGLAGLATLKIGAIRDKQLRIEHARGKNRPSAEIAYEQARLALHASDLLLVRRMLESTAALPDLAALCNRHGQVRETAQTAAAWFDDNESDRLSIANMQGSLQGSPDPLQHALDV